MERDVVKKTNVHLWQKVKVLKNQQCLGKGVRFVMKLHNPIKFQGLGAKDLALAQEKWARIGGGNENLVRTGINSQRNYCLNETRDCHKPKFQDEKDEEVPTPEEIYDIAMRKGMEEGDETKERCEKLFVIYWEFPLVKVAGVQHWCVVDCCVLVAEADCLVPHSHTFHFFSFSQVPKQALQVLDFLHHHSGCQEEGQGFPFQRWLLDPPKQ